MLHATCCKPYASCSLLTSGGRGYLGTPLVSASRALHLSLSHSLPPSLSLGSLGPFTKTRLSPLNPRLPSLVWSEYIHTVLSACPLLPRPTSFYSPRISSVRSSKALLPASSGTLVQSSHSFHLPTVRWQKVPSTHSKRLCSPPKPRAQTLRGLSRVQLRLIPQSLQAIQNHPACHHPLAPLAPPHHPHHPPGPPEGLSHLHLLPPALPAACVFLRLSSMHPNA